jgi:hypothetical protein
VETLHKISGRAVSQSMLAARKAFRFLIVYLVAQIGVSAIYGLLDQDSRFFPHGLAVVLFCMLLALADLKMCARRQKRIAEMSTENEKKKSDNQ